MFKWFMILALLGQSSFALATQTHTLACRGGSQTSYHWSSPKVPWSKGSVRVTFSKTANGHNYRAVQANQCAWLDRKVRHNEPGQVCVKNVGVINYSFERQGKILANQFDTSTAKRRLLQSDFWSGRTFYIQVFHNGQGCLEFVRRGRN